MCCSRNLDYAYYSVSIMFFSMLHLLLLLNHYIRWSLGIHKKKSFPLRPIVNILYFYCTYICTYTIHAYMPISLCVCVYVCASKRACRCRRRESKEICIVCSMYIYMYIFIYVCRSTCSHSREMDIVPQLFHFHYHHDNAIIRLTLLGQFTSIYIHVILSRIMIFIIIESFSFFLFVPPRPPLFSAQ